MPKPRDSYRFLLNYAFFLLGRRQYSEVELIKKCRLRAKKVTLEESEDALEKVIVRLHELEYLNDEKLAVSFLQNSLNLKPQGKRSFLVHMRKKGVAHDVAQKAWDAAQIDEDILAHRLIASKMGQFEKLDLIKQNRKIQYLLASRGFKSSLIWDILRERRCPPT